MKHEIHNLLSAQVPEPAPDGPTAQLFAAWAAPRNASAKPKPKPSDKPAAPQIDRGVLQVQKGNYVDQRLAMKEAYAKLRGFDVGTKGKGIPRTTNADVVQIAQYWTTSVVRFGISRRADDKAPLRNWREAMSRVSTNVVGKEPGDTYVDNERFWERDVGRIAIWLNSLGVIPTKASLAWSAFKEAVVESPRVVADAVVTAGKKAADVAEKTGEIATDIVTAPFEGAARSLGIGKLLIGAGVIVAGVLIVPRLIK